MSSLETFKSETPISKSQNPNSQVAYNAPPSSKTPEKPRQLRHNCNVALSIEQIKRSAAKSGINPSHKQRTEDIDLWLEEIPKKTGVRRPVKLPEKYEMLGEFFNSLDISIRRLRKKGLKSIFANIGPAVEYLTDRRFKYSHLAQLKFILPEVIEIKKVLMWDERAGSKKLDLHVTMNVDAVEIDGKLKSDVGGGIMHMRRVFHKRLADISKSHPEDYEVPEETLPHPFNCAEQHMHSDRVTFPSSSSPGEVLNSVQADGIPDEARAPNLSVSESNLNVVCFIEKTNTVSSTYGQVLATPTKEIFPIENDDGLPRTCANIDSTPEKLASTPARLMTSTPALHPPKRCYMSPDDNCTNSPNKLVRRPLCSRSLKFNSPVKNTILSPDDNSTRSPNKLVGHPLCSRSLKFDTSVKKMFEEKVHVLDDISSDGDICDVLSEDLLQSLKDKEKKAIERNAAILQAKRQRHMLSSLPELFNMIHFLFQSMNCSLMKKEDLVDKLTFSHSDIVDEEIVEKQLKLLLELVPEWISEKLASGRDLLLIKINKMSNPESIRARLEEAK